MGRADPVDRDVKAGITHMGTAKGMTSLMLFPVLSISLVSFLLVVGFSWTPHPPQFPGPSGLPDPSPPPPKLAYFISGSDGDGDRLLRLLNAVYHPRNHYLLSLDLRASEKQRKNLVFAVQNAGLFKAAGNVNVVGKPGYSNPEGSTSLASVLHGAAALLRYSKEWDWFINLVASDYPLITQDDFLHVLSFVPRDLNFLKQNGKIDWLESQRMRSAVVDPGTYLAARREIFHSTQKRALPTSFKFSTGSPFVMLSRRFVEFTIMGRHNLPRTLLLYFTNTRNPAVGYFQSLGQNSKEFCAMIVNSDLRPSNGSSSDSDLGTIMGSGAAFAGGIRRGDSHLDRIDAMVLGRQWGRVVPGGWCVGASTWWNDPCSVWGDAGILRPGPGAHRFEKFLVRLMRSNESSIWTSSCGNDDDVYSGDHTI